MYKAFIFDLDGTLLDTLADLTDSVNATMRRFSLPEKSLEEVRRAVGNGGRNLMRGVVPGAEAHPRFEEIFDFYVPYYQAHCQNKTRPYDGIMPLLRQLKSRGIAMAIVSNKGDGAVKELAETYFEGLVDEAVGEREGIRRKPDPDAVLEAMRLLGSTREETLYVGDSEVDYATAHNAGLDVALVTWGFREREKLAALGPDHLIDTPAQLLGLLEGQPSADEGIEI